MVLLEFGVKLGESLRKLQSSSKFDDKLLVEVLNEISRTLLENDVQLPVVVKIKNDIYKDVKLMAGTAGYNAAKMAQQAVFNNLVKMVDPGNEPYKLVKGKANVIMFVGLQGAGKTTTIAKFAHFHRSKGWKTAMVCADTFRAGAFEQLKQNAVRARVPFYGNPNESNPVAIAKEGVEQFKNEGYELILVDTSGRHKQEASLFEEMIQVSNVVSPDETIFVMDASIGQAAADQARAFSATVDVGSVIITKMDGSSKGGGALSAVAETGSPITFIGVGERFDELERFQPKGFISRLLGLGDLSTLAEKLQESTKDFDEKEFTEKLKKGVFTLRMMGEQITNILKLGPIDKIMNLIPGFNQLIPMMGKADPSKMLKKFIYMLDSMTEGELDGHKGCTMDESRIARVARGSGCSVVEVKTMLQFYKQFSNIFSRMGKSGLLKHGEAGLQQQMQRDPQGMMQKMMGGMNPQMAKQMGGQQGLMNMMKQMGGGGGGMPDMSKLMKMMGR